MVYVGSSQTKQWEQSTSCNNIQPYARYCMQVDLELNTKVHQVQEIRTQR